MTGETFSGEKSSLYASGVKNSTAREDEAKWRLPLGVLPATARCWILEYLLRPGLMHNKQNARISRLRVTLFEGTSSPNCCENRLAGVL